MSYLNTRLKALGISRAHNLFKVADDSPRGWHHHPHFSEDAQGNILIHYFNLLGEVESYQSGRWRTEKPYRVKRLKSPTEGRKYVQPSGASSRVYFTPQIIKDYQAATPIPLLFVTEGQFKAFKGHLEGLPIIGISGIWNFRDSNRLDFKAELKHLIKRC